VDLALQDTIRGIDEAVARAAIDSEDRTVAKVLLSALSLRRFTATTDALTRTFVLLSTRRDHPSAPKDLESARRTRAHAHEVIARGRADARTLEPHVDPAVAILVASGHLAEAEEVQSASNAYLASLASLAAAADDVIDVMLVYEAELDPENVGPPISLAELEAKLDAAE
jgi:hypothetical protein